MVLVYDFIHSLALFLSPCILFSFSFVWVIWFYLSLSLPCFICLILFLFGIWFLFDIKNFLFFLLSTFPLNKNKNYIPNQIPSTFKQNPVLLLYSALKRYWYKKKTNKQNHNYLLPLFPLARSLSLT